MVNKYVAAGKFFGEKVVKPIVKKVFKPQKTTGTEVVQPFKFKPAKSKLEKSVKNLQIATAKESGKIKGIIQKMESDIEPFRRKLRQTTQKIDNKPVTESGFNKGKNMKKGGRAGLKSGTNPFARKSNIKKIQEVFGPKQVKKKEKPKARMQARKGSPDPKKKKKFPDLTGDGKVTFADVLKGRGVINGKKKPKKKVI
jgi:hypothetical protein